VFCPVPIGERGEAKDGNIHANLPQVSKTIDNFDSVKSHCRHLVLTFVDYPFFGQLLAVILDSNPLGVSSSGLEIRHLLAPSWSMGDPEKMQPQPSERDFFELRGGNRFFSFETLNLGLP
jgi:hypothetical protein